MLTGVEWMGDTPQTVMTGNSFFSLIEIMVLYYGASIIMVDT